MCKGVINLLNEFNFLDKLDKFLSEREMEEFQSLLLQRNSSDITERINANIQLTHYTKRIKHRIKIYKKNNIYRGT